MISGSTTLPGNKRNKVKAHNVTGKCIVAADRGFVWVGDIERSGDCLLIHNAKNIRRWGTTRGIGELANGPTPSTVLDDQGEVCIPWHAVIHITLCKTNSW
jgi:hypothetical protein